MPFGAVFGSLVLVALGSFIGLRLLGTTWSLAKLTGALLIVFAVAVMGGLLSRHGWARWAGVAGSVLLAVLSGSRAAQSGQVPDWLGALASILAAILLVIPATGRFRRADDPPPFPPAPEGDGGGEAVPPPVLPVAPRVAWGSRVLAVVAAACGLGLAATLASSAFIAPPRPGDVAREPVGEGEVPWLQFSEGLEKARSADLPVLVDFYAVWCGPCKIMEKRVLRDPIVVERLEKLVAVRVDAEEEVPRGGITGLELSERYDVTSYPTLVLMDGSGREIARRTGVASPPAFAAWLDSVMEGWRKGQGSKST
jgi:thiol-disulfide isomerase/thioredoxin